MQVTKTKTSTSTGSNVQAKRQPFFNKEGQGSFFSKSTLPKSNNSDPSFFGPTTLQPKLSIGRPNDKYEVEADAMADRVMQRLNGQTASDGPSIDQTRSDGPKGGNNNIQAKSIGTLQAKCADVQPKPIDRPLVQAKCESCEEEEIQRKEAPLFDGSSARDMIGVRRKPIFESEAGMSEPDLQTHPELQMKLDLQTKPDVQTRLDVQLKPIWTKGRSEPFGIPTAQAKCSTCEEKEKVQKKEEETSEPVEQEDILKKPTLESDTERTLQSEPNIAKASKPITMAGNTGDTSPAISPSIHLKCEECEKEEMDDSREEQELHRKEVGDVTGNPTDEEEDIQANSENGVGQTPMNLQSRLDATKGRGSPLSSGTGEAMGSAFGADFSDVHIHTGSEAAQMAKDLKAHAFTHGSDIYFNEGKYDTQSRSGQHLLAHELTHTIQQGRSPVQAKKENPTEVPDLQKLPWAAPVAIWGGRYLAKKLVKWGIKKVMEDEGDLLHISAAAVKAVKTTRIDFMGLNKFDPPMILAKHIQMFAYMEQWWLSNSYLAPYLGKKYLKEMTEGPELNIKYGKMGHRDNVRIRYHIASDTYEMKPYFFEIKHSAFNTDKRKQTTYIGLGIDKATSDIYGGMAFLPKGLLIQADTKAAMRFLMDEDTLTQLVFGNDYQKDKYTKVVFTNEVKNGKLVLELAGLCETGGGQLLQGAFVSWDDLHAWSGKMNLDVQGLETTQMPVERDPFSELLGRLGDLQLEKSWNINNIKVKLKASYLNGNLEIRGNAKYAPKKDEGSRIKQAEVTLLVTTKRKAWDEVKNQLPENEGKEALHLPSMDESDKELSLIGWGSVSLSIVKDEKGKDVITGQAGLVLDPDSHLTVFGTIRVASKYKLLEEKGIDWKPISPKLVAEFGPFFVKIPRIPAGLNFTGKGGLYYKYMFGPLTLYDIHIDGIYSTNPKINKELSVTARLNLSAELNGKVGVTGRMAARVGTSFPYLGLDVTAVEMGVGGTASLKGYSDLEATFGKREQPTEDGKVVRDFIKGTLQIAGELSLGLEGNLSFEVLYGTLKDKKLEGNWPIANAGIAIDFDYNIGDELSKEKLAKIIDIKKTKFNRKHFVKGVLKDKMPKETGLVKGGFIDETGKKIGEVKDKPIPIPEETVTPVKVKDDFNMDGTWHYLELEIGAPGQDIVLKMATTPEILLDKMREHRKATELLLHRTTDKQEKKRLKQMLIDLKELQKTTTNLIIRLKRMGIDPEESTDKSKLPGFEALGEQIGAFGERYDLSDFGNPLSGDPDRNPSSEIGDGTYDYPITIRWTKRSWHNPITLKPKNSGWTRKGKTPPPAVDVYPDMDSTTEIEVAPTQYLGSKFTPFPGQKDKIRDGDGEAIKVVDIGVDGLRKPQIDKKMKRTRSKPKRKGMEGRFRTLLKNYSYDWSDMSPDHVQDLGWDGPDAVDNLWPLYRDMNAGIGNKIYNQTVEYIENGQIKTNRPYYMVGKWFIIKSWGDIE
ncbi:DUF4157 domain-containing protein [Pricia sp. S334]|uniref:DUF4157 domain-containing protein n=1 Tax=Pricia mediterranea TaxID=3076079 RepID=A0ABU3L4C4_9FLAO|nr:DUF4157 domain-containing protein [Pricia sp. S334]MDT7828238.1 DUF4157 domain-containing protein [Pricia sp. S334]